MYTHAHATHFSCPILAKERTVHFWARGGLMTWNGLFCLRMLSLLQGALLVLKSVMAAQEMGTITAPQTCNTRALAANMLGSRPRKKLRRKRNAVGLLGKEIPWKEAEIQHPLLNGCSAGWLSRQLGTQQKKAAPRQMIMGTWRQDATDKNKQESEPLSHSLALNDVEQILKIFHKSLLVELRQAQPTSSAVQLSCFPRITVCNLPVICLLLSGFREQPRWLTTLSLLTCAKTAYTR